MNKTLTFCLLALAVGYISAGEEEDLEKYQGIVDALLNKTINKIVDNLTDPLVLKDISINSTQEALNGSLDVYKPTITGLKKLVASKISVNILSMNVNITISIPELIANFKYDANLLLEALIPLYGKGLINVNFDDIELIISGHAQITKPIQIQNMTVLLDIKNAVFNLNGLLNNPELSALLSVILNDNFCKFLDTYDTVISNLISPVLETLINKLLAGNSTSEEFLEDFQSIRDQYQHISHKLY